MGTALSGLLPYPRFKAINVLGIPLIGGKLYTYAEGSETEKVAYTDIDCTVAHENPIILNSEGEATIYLRGTYKIILKTALDVEIWTLDNVSGIPQNQGGIYYVDYNEVDQGATGDGYSLKAFVDAIGVVKNATIYLPHNSGGNTTTYTLTTALTIPANIKVKVEDGARITKSGTPTLTINGPFEAGSYQVFAGFDRSDIVWGSRSTNQLNAEWFGTITDILTSTYFGYQAGNLTEVGRDTVIENTAFGQRAGMANTTGIQNVAFGHDSLKANTTGSFNTAIGVQTLYTNTIGVENTAIGCNTLFYNTEGNSNVGIGVGTLFLNTTGIQNTALGNAALQRNTTGSNNTAIGFQAMMGEVAGDPHTGHENVAIGKDALYISLGDHNIAIGVSALVVNTGSDNVGIGPRSLYGNTTGTGNIGIGGDAGRSNTTGTNNTFIGYQSGYGGTSGNLTNATAIGYGAVATRSNAIVLGAGTNRLRIADTALSPGNNASGDAGEICWDTGYLYVCTATNTWERIELTGGY